MAIELLETKTDVAALEEKVLTLTAVQPRAGVRRSCLLGTVLVIILGKFLRKEESEGGRRAREGEGPPHKQVLSPRQEWGITWRLEGRVSNEWKKPKWQEKTVGFVSGQVCPLREHQGQGPHWPQEVRIEGHSGPPLLSHPQTLRSLSSALSNPEKISSCPSF